MYEKPYLSAIACMADCNVLPTVVTELSEVTVGDVTSAVKIYQVSSDLLT